MNTRRSSWGFAFAALLSLMSQLQAELVRVEFSGTIEESPFVTAGYRLGDPITGWFTYQQPGQGVQWSPKNTHYPLEEAHVFLGGSDYWDVASWVDMYHAVDESSISGITRFHSTTPVDMYDLRAVIVGPGVEGASAYYMHLVLTDVDSSFYGGSPPYPVDFPPPSEFEFQTFKVNFLGGAPFSQDVWARLDSFNVQAAIPDQGNSFLLLAVSFGLVVLVGRVNSARY